MVGIGFAEIVILGLACFVPLTVGVILLVVYLVNRQNSPPPPARPGCPDCGQRVTATMENCPRCGRPLQDGGKGPGAASTTPSG